MNAPETTNRISTDDESTGGCGPGESSVPRDIVVILNRPRLTFTAHSQAIEKTLFELGTTGLIAGMIAQSGVFWEQCMQRAVLQALQAEKRGTLAPVSAFLFVDFDTVFDVSQVIRLRDIMTKDPSIDAVVPVQAARHWDQPLLHDPKRNHAQPLTDLTLGHFGCTLIRRSVFSLERTAGKRSARLPWFWSLPNAEGLWDEGRVDPDIYFWNSLRNNGGRIVQANDVVVGHVEMAVMWPKRRSVCSSSSAREQQPEFTTHWQRLIEYEQDGPPVGLDRLFTG
ncbi:MAG: hypothetical protein ACOC0P_01290 [Planctomycetota bacterium]